MVNILVAGGSITTPARDELRGIILSPPPAPYVASWATSKKKHHILHAGISTPTRQLWGSDQGTIEVLPEHVDLLHTVEHQLQHHSRTAVLNGHYSTPAISKQGHAQWSEQEDLISIYRGQRVLDLLVFAAEKTKPAVGDTDAGPLFRQESIEMIDPTDQQAADLLSYIAQGSQYRKESGLDFWNGYFRSRIERHAHRPLAEMVSRLLDECQCGSTGEALQEVMHAITLMDEDATRAIEQSIRGRAALLVALAFTAMKDRR